MALNKLNCLIMALNMCVALTALINPWFVWQRRPDPEVWPPVHLYFDYEVQLKHTVSNNSSQ